jgi:hypothetical protein
MRFKIVQKNEKTLRDVVSWAHLHLRKDAVGEDDKGTMKIKPRPPPVAHKRGYQDGE